MPQHKAMEKLHKGSKMAEINAAISECIMMEMQQGGMKQDQAVAMCHEMARKKTGKPMPKK